MEGIRALSAGSTTPNESPDHLDELLNGGFRYAFSLCHDRSEAEDLVQESCASILAVDGPWQKSYLFTTIRNHFIDRYRRGRRLLFLPLDGSPDSEGTDPIDQLEVADWEMPDFLASGALHDALGKLRPEERETMYLAVVEEYTAQEIADMTDRPRGTILSLLHRTRAKLRKTLEKEQTSS